MNEREFGKWNTEFIGEKVVTRLDRCSSGMLRRAECKLGDDVSGEPVRPLFKFQTVEGEKLSRNVLPIYAA